MKKITNFKKEQIKKGIYILPSLFTSASLFAGFYSIIASLRGDFKAAAIAIIISTAFDFLDGKVARMTNTCSQFGVEYDSLSDLVAFGVAPAIMIYSWALQPYGRFGWAAAFIFMACGALRLARFNVHAGEPGSSRFTGLPIPAGGGMLATTVLIYYYLGGDGNFKHITILLMTFFISYLMVSSIPFMSLKKIEFAKKKPFGFLVFIILVFAVIAAEPQISLFLIASIYCLSGPFLLLLKRLLSRNIGIKETAAESIDKHY